MPLSTNCLAFVTHNSLGTDLLAVALCAKPEALSPASPMVVPLRGIGVLPTIGAGLGSPSAGVFISLEFSNANYLHENTGPFEYVDASGTLGPDAGPTIGGEGVVGIGDCNRTIVGGRMSLGLGGDLPAPGEAHWGGSNTSEWRWWGEN